MRGDSGTGDEQLYVKTYNDHVYSLIRVRLSHHGSHEYVTVDYVWQRLQK